MNNEYRRRTIRSFAILFIFLFGSFGLWLGYWETPAGNPAPIYRAGLEFNQWMWLKMFRERRERDSGRRQWGKVPRVHGLTGLSRFDESQWRLVIDRGDQKPVELNMEQIRALPRTEENLELKCIEGWSEYMTVAGVRFSDLLRAVNAGVRGGQSWTESTRTDDLYTYGGLETPDGQFYVSLDMKSLMHPQTLLAYEINGMPIAFENGAPLRLVVPVKYLTKSIKRVGKIFFSDVRPRDYWFDRGMDWYAGL